MALDVIASGSLIGRLETEDFGPKSRLTLLLDHFGAMKDTREPWRVAYRLREVLFVAVCGTLADCDDDENVVAWGEAHLDFLRRFSPFHHGVPCADWLATLMNRIDGDLFSAGFFAGVAQACPGRADLVAIDGKSVRRSHDHASGRRPLHLVSAFATKRRLVLGQEAVEDKSNEIGAIPALLERLDLKGALVSVDAMGCDPAVAEAITGAGADYLLAVKGAQPTLHAEIAAYFDTAPETQLDTETTLDKSRGRIETRTCVVSRIAGWPGSGPINMAAVRRFACNLLRQIDDRKSLKTRRKLAGWSTDALLNALQAPAH